MSLEKKERIAAILLFALFAAGFFISKNYPAIPKMLPVFVTVTGMILSLGLLVKTILPKKKESDTPTSKAVAQEKGTEPVPSEAENAEKASTPSATGSMLTPLLSIVLLVAYIVLIRLVGFYVTSFFYILGMSFLIEGKGKHRWYVYPIVAVGILATVYVLFSLFLKVPLPKGFLI